MELVIHVCVWLYLKFLEKVQVLLPQALVGPLKLGCPLLLVETGGCVQQFILQDVVLHLISLELLGHINLTDLKEKGFISLVKGD